MSRLVLESQVPAQYNSASWTRIVREISSQVNALSEGRLSGRYTAMSSYPTTGAWAKGDIVWNDDPDSGDFLGWVCVSSGTPGTWAGFGTVGNSRKNPLINGLFGINQAAPATSADDTYAHDQWIVLTQTNTIAVSTLTDVENGLPFMARLTQSQAVAQRMGYAQIIEGRDCKKYRGKAVTFRFGRMRCSASQAIRYAILEWTGTEDAVTSDVVNDWTSTDYTDGAAKFFVDTSFTPSGNTSHTPAAATLTDGPSLTVTLGSTFNNLVVLSWTEGTAAQNVTLDLGLAQLDQGGTASDFDYRPEEDERDRALRFYERWGEVASGFPTIQVRAGAAEDIILPMPFQVEKRIAPTVTVNGTWATAGVTSHTFSRATKKGCCWTITTSGAGLFAVVPDSTDDWVGFDSRL